MKQILILILLVALTSQVTRLQADSCLKLNCPITCPDEGIHNKCQEELTQWEELFAKDSKSVCKLYSDEFTNLKNDDELTAEILKNWGECYNTWESVQGIDKYVGKYIAQCQNSCVTKGENPDDRSFEKSLKGLYSKCKEINCNTKETKACEDDTDCKALLDKYSSCHQGAGDNQCIKARKEFETTAVDTILPYSWYACQESCKIYTENTLFNAAIACESHCQKAITVLGFSRADCQKCESKYAPDCPNYNPELKEECESQKKSFKDNLNCDTCDFEEKVLADTELARYLPKSCSDCILTAYKAKQGEAYQKLITEIYLPVINQCAVADNISVLQRKVTATIQQFNECIEDAVCKENDDKCKEEFEKFEICQRASNQCADAIEKSDIGEPDSIYPYEMVICKESCYLIGNAQFEEIQKTWETCEVYQEPKEPEYLPFSESELRICIETNIPLCASKDTDCKTAIESIKTQKLSDSDCKQCEKDKKHPNAKGKVPVSCDACEYCELNTDEFPQIVTNFIIPATRACYTNGHVQDLQKKFNIKVKDELSCQKKCKECEEKDTDCIAADKQFEDCIVESNQCNYAKEQYKSRKPTDQYPYSLIACEESCKNFNSAFFNEIQKCWDTCLTYNPDPEVTSLDYAHFTDCLKLNQPSCADSDKKCLGAIVQIQIDRENDLYCQECRDDLKDDRTNGKMPLSCVKCEENIQQTLEEQFQTPLIIDFYFPARVGCAKTGSLPEYKPTIAIHQICQNQCGSCPQENVECATAYKKYNDCKEKSAQCRASSASLKDKKASDKYPFSEVACEESCKNMDDEDFNIIQKCWEKCVNYVPEVLPEFLEFSYLDYQNCLELNEADCNLDDKICRDDYAKILTEKQKVQSCLHCSKDRNHAKADGRMPVSCRQCDLEVILAFESDGERQNPKIISQFIIPAIQQCAETANVDFLQKKYDQTVSGNKDCVGKCPACPESDTECNKAMAKYTECYSKSEQCQTAEKFLNSLKSTDIYPFAILACQESCLNNLSPKFIEIYQCREKCAHFDGDVDIEVTNFLQKDYSACVEHYVAVCADYDNDCKKNKTAIESRKVKYDECEICETELKILALQKMETNYPISCQKCQLKITNPEKSDNFNTFFKNFVLNSWQQCANTSKVTVEKRQIDATIASYNSCSKRRCGACDEKDMECLKSQEKFNSCIQNKANKQCQFALSEYTKEDFNPYPYSYLICQDSCKVLDVQNYARILDCYKNCQENSYERQNFTYTEYSICLNVSLPYPEKNSIAFQDKNWMDSCLEGESSPSCTECTYLTENDGEQKLYPAACAKCVTDCVNSQKDRKWDSFFVTYILPVYQQCKSDGKYNYKGLPFSIYQKKEERENCLQTKKCDNLPCDSECQKMLNRTKECIDESWQCRNAAVDYTIRSSKDLVPASIEICRIGCVPDEAKNGTFNNSQYTAIEECTSFCNKNTSKYQEFNTSQVNQCVKKYVPGCPDWDSSCVYAYDIIEKKCYENSKQPDANCQECHQRLKEKASERNENEVGKHPKVCQMCMEDCLNPFQTSDSYVMRHMIVPNLRQCHNSSSINLDAVSGNSSVATATACMRSVCKSKLNCGSSKDRSRCLQYYNNYTRCKKSDQCQLALDSWSKVSRNQSSLEPVPVEYLICDEACEPRDQEEGVGRKDFFQIVQCSDFCFTSGYKPDVIKPDDDKDHDDVTPPVPDNKPKNNQILGISYILLAIIGLLLI